MAAVLFDLDGTLTDPGEGITKCICYALESMGHVPPDAESLSWAIGPPLLGSLRQLLGECTDDEAHKCLAHYRERFTQVGLFENRVYDGVTDMLEHLIAQGHRLFVATSKPATYATRILEHFELQHYFGGIYGSELDGTRADKAHLLSHLIEREALHGYDTWMVGDRVHDVVGARVNGLRCIGALWGYGSREELSSAGADHLCEQPADVPACVMESNHPGHGPARCGK